MSVDIPINYDFNIFIEKVNVGGKNCIMCNQLYGDSAYKQEFENNLEINNETKLYNYRLISTDKLINNLNVLTNIILNDKFSKSLMGSKYYRNNQIIALELLLCIYYQIFNNIKLHIDNFITKIIPYINKSQVSNKDVIIDRIYDLKRIYSFNTIFPKEIEFINVNNKDGQKVIINKKNINKNNNKNNNIVRINNFYNMCNNDISIYYNLVSIIKVFNIFPLVNTNKYYIIENNKIKLTNNKINTIKKYDTVLKEKYMLMWKIK